MAITQSVCASFKLERYEGIHNFLTDTLMIALYAGTANLGFATTNYTTAGEFSGAGYTAGGQQLFVANGYPQLNPVASGGYAAGSVVITTFSNSTWAPFSGTVLGALVYNASKNNRAIFCLDFGQYVSVAGSLTIQWPTADAVNAILRTV